MSKTRDEIMAGNTALLVAVLAALESARGRNHAISRRRLLFLVRNAGVVTRERGVREAVRILRRNGHLICSAAGEDGGYYLAETREEFDEFIRAEYQAKIRDMAVTLAAMRKTARAQFGHVVQPAIL